MPMRRSAEWLGSKPSSVIVRGCGCRLRAFRKNALAAAMSRVRLRCDSTVLPSSSTARYRFTRPGILLDIPKGTIRWQNVLKEKNHAQPEEAGFRGCGRSPQGD